MFVRFKMVLVLCTVAVVALKIYGEDERRTGTVFTLQTGFLSFKNEYGSFEAVPFGVGARYFVQVRPWIRTGGGLGYMSFSYKNSGDKGSTFILGYGGTMVELTKKVGKMKFAGGLMIGGGNFSNIHIFSTNDADVSDVFYHRGGSFIISPLLSCEYAFKERMSLMLMVDYFVGPGLKSDRLGFGPKIHLGLLAIN